ETAKKPRGTYELLLLLRSSKPPSGVQECRSAQDLVDSLRQVEKMLAVHEASYQQGLRSLRKRISALHNSTVSLSVRPPASCPRPEPPTYGRRLGRVFGIGHEVHFLCRPGYELIGPRTRACLESLKWSGQQPMCRRKPPFCDVSSCFSSGLNSTGGSAASLPPTAPSPSSSPPSPASVRPSHCTHFLGSTRCTCDVGFTISGRDNNICTDIDECRLFPLGQPGRLCVHRCVNTPGSFHCVCPAGYELAGDGRSCSDTDECEIGMRNCSEEQVCVNTYGGFQCATVECPNTKNATYIKTSPTLRLTGMFNVSYTAPQRFPISNKMAALLVPVLYRGRK
uniref:Sushi domain-containing protein n=1 Tax=Mola mola TaxID=94237 RepID=A0A3Q3XL47_MOLML